MTPTPSIHIRHAGRGARPGVALVMAVVAMAVLGALVAGVFFSALREQRDARDSVRRVQALAAAEYGLAAALSPDSWRSVWNITSRRGPLHRSVYTPDPGTSDTVRIWKLERNALLITSVGVAGPEISRATRRIALLVTLRIPQLAARSAVIARNSVSVGDSSLISGTDTVTPSWNCPPPDGERPAIIVPVASSVDDVGCASGQCISGTPPVATDSAAASADMLERLGTMQRDSVAAAALQLAADVVLDAPEPALDGSGECDVYRQGNLGDPLRVLGPASPCADHFPVLHSPGNMRIEGGAGQGMLLVDGNLTLAGGAHFSGVAVVRGVLEITERSELHGSVLASTISVHEGSRIRYSSCAVERALRGAAEPVVPEGLAWSEMY